MDPETQRLVDLLKVSLKILGITNREVARRMEMSPSYISKLFSGSSELRLDHVIRICRAAGMEPAEFFSLAYPRPPVGGTPAAEKLKDLLQNVHAPQLKAVAPLDEDQLEKMLRATLERMLNRAGV